MKTCGKPCNCESYRDHLLSVGIAASAMPSRKGDAAATKARERRWDGDLDAYKRLRDDGLQPPTLDGCRRLEQGAEHQLEIETGHLLQDLTT